VKNPGGLHGIVGRPGFFMPEIVTPKCSMIEIPLGAIGANSNLNLTLSLQAYQPPCNVT
jgi:hypothetical protein